MAQGSQDRPETALLMLVYRISLDGKAMIGVMVRQQRASVLRAADAAHLHIHSIDEGQQPLHIDLRGRQQGVAKGAGAPGHLILQAGPGHL